MKPPFKCGQCGAKALYRDEDIVNNLSWIACMTCGNRWPGGFKPIRIDGEEDMANKKGTCTNCGRPDLQIANAKGHCHTCHAAGKGLEGEAYEAALLATKERVNDPEYHRVGKKIETLPIAAEKVAKIKNLVRSLADKQKSPEDKKTLKKVAPCVNCTRELPLEGKGLCGGCRAVTIKCKKKNMTVEETAKEMAAAATRFTTAKLPAGDKRPGKTISAPPPPLAEMLLVFAGEEDLKIFSFLESEAKRCRRTTDQQALWILQRYLPGNGAAEAGGYQ